MNINSQLWRVVESWPTLTRLNVAVGRTVSVFGTVRDKGLGALTKLPALTELSLVGAYHITDNGVCQLAALAHLTDLNLFGCIQVALRHGLRAGG
jgi:hypothetical protein